MLTAEQRAKGNALTLEDLESTMNQHWRQIGNSVEEDNSEVGLAGADGNKIVCFKCGEEGHKATRCPKNRKRTGKGKDRKCYNCGKTGHLKVDCFEDEKNAHKRPSNWKSCKTTSETAAVATDTGNTIEYLLCGMCFPKTVRSC